MKLNRNSKEWKEMRDSTLKKLKVAGSVPIFPTVSKKPKSTLTAYSAR